VLGATVVVAASVVVEAVVVVGGGVVAATVVSGPVDAVGSATVTSTTLVGESATFALLEHAPSTHSDTINRPVRFPMVLDRSLGLGLGTPAHGCVQELWAPSNNALNPVQGPDDVARDRQRERSSPRCQAATDGGRGSTVEYFPSRIAAKHSTYVRIARTNFASTKLAMRRTDRLQTDRHCGFRPAINKAARPLVSIVQ
jgi:hypothetical protein